MTLTDQQATQHPLDADLAPSAANWFGWAAFLAASWTWCIGMFLPHLLVRDYGVPGWIVFAVPNVIGAAAMGWVLKQAESSRLVVAQHRHACVCFSAVTIAFHLFFTVAVIAALARSLDLALSTVIALTVLMYLLMTRHNGGADRVLAMLVLIVSALAFVASCEQILHTTADLPRFFSSTKHSPADLLWLTPICVFGFALCPYLDLTFHRARQQTSAPRASFGVGFGGLFLVMILFTLLYSSVFDDVIERWLGIVLFVHMVVQSAFTMAVHAREIRDDGAYAIIIAAGLTVLAWSAHWVLRRGDLIDDVDPGETIYRVFMGFYGLVFPAYVWLVVLPSHAATKRRLAVFALSTLVALPMFWMGFVVQRMIWLAPGIAVLLLARLAVRTQQNSAPT